MQARRKTTPRHAAKLAPSAQTTPIAKAPPAASDGAPYRIETMAKAVAEGARSAGADVTIKRVPELVPEDLAKASHYKLDQPAPVATIDELPSYDAILFGTGTRFGNMTSQMKNFLDQAGGLWAQGKLVGKVGSVFTSTATQHGGQESTILTFHPVLLHLGMVIVGLPYAFQGQMGMYVRALSYMMSHGSDGLRQVAEDAVLNANYIKARLQDLMSPAFPDGPCMHEALFDDEWLKGTDITTLDFAKAMIDEGFHPMTMYFPLVVHGAMLIEPTETESKAELDRFIEAMRLLAQAAKAGDTDRFKGAPFHAPLRRLDETRAARSPVLRWTAPEGSNQAA